MTARKAMFFDRDGVINKDKAYVHRWEDFEFMTGAIEGMKKIQDAGYALIIVTNQSGLARGYYTEVQYQALNSRLNEHLLRQGVRLDGIYHCPHHPMGTVPELSVECYCRKPKPGMLFQAARELVISLPDSVLIGDKVSDIEAARAAGVGRAFGVVSDNAETISKYAGTDRTFSSLYDCAAYISTT